ncbi:hypothetical protein [Dactylosporangium sp. CA-092794]|uniref:hypothetical protein n=1 Tax=Dactylosporangium sp. CA-092794 TaxID=3239929 RepID=UPI003D8D6B9C
MRRLLILGATTTAVLAIGGTALANSGPGRHDDPPPPSVAVSPAESPSVSGSPSVSDNPSDDVSPYASASPYVDDHGGLRGGHGADDVSASPYVDDHGGLRGGHGADDGPGDDRGGSRHRR